jgi:putative toxin-antitoxin system antitoxin component (TIGR02293 family)
MSTATLISALDDSAELLRISRKGIKFKIFEEIANLSPFNLKEWSKFLHITERTILRYKKDDKPFEPIQSERIIGISKVLKKGTEVFGSRKNFEVWLHSEIIALGGIMPKDLMDSSFGIEMIIDELIRIEHGILA